MEPETTVFDSLRACCVPVKAHGGRPILWYCCGPTVYDSAHVGHARTYVSFDIGRRVFERLLQTPITYVMGVTDVDDKIIARANATGVSASTIARRYEEEFMQDMAALGVRPPSLLCRVSEHLEDIVDHIRTIETAGFAYIASDGSGVYLDTAAMGNAYGKLRRGQAGGEHQAPAGAAGAGAAPPCKRSPADFALWKSAKPGDAAAGVAWPSPWGLGRPGWHIECSAMVTATLGRTIDLHSGGIDLAFPHHCNEIAQAECAHGWVGHPEAEDRRWVSAWMHAGHLHIAGRKMSKSLKNFVTVATLLREGEDMYAALACLGEGTSSEKVVRTASVPFSCLSSADRADAFRLYCLSHSYRSDITLVAAQLDEAAALLVRLRRALTTVTDSMNTLSTSTEDTPPVDPSIRDQLNTARSIVTRALRDDLDTPAALRALTALASTAASVSTCPPRSAESSLLLWEASHFVADWLACFGLSFPHTTLVALRGKWPAALVGASCQSSTAAALPSTDHMLPAAVLELATFRAAVRKEAVALLKQAKLAARKSQPPPQSSNLNVGSALLEVEERHLPPSESSREAATRLIALCDDVRDSVLPTLGWTVADGGATAGLKIERTLAVTGRIPTTRTT